MNEAENCGIAEGKTLEDMRESIRHEVADGGPTGLEVVSAGPTRHILAWVFLLVVSNA